MECCLKFLGEFSDRLWRGWTSGNFAEQDPRSSQLSTKTMILVCERQSQTDFPEDPSVR